MMAKNWGQVGGVEHCCGPKYEQAANHSNFGYMTMRAITLGIRQKNHSFSTTITSNGQWLLNKNYL